MRKFLFVSAFSLSWSLSIVGTKLSVDRGADPMSLVVATTFITGILLTIYIGVFRRPELVRLNRSVFLTFLRIGFFAALAYLAGNLGLRQSTSINYSFLVKSSLVFTLLLAAFFLGEKLTGAKIALMFLFAMGAYLLITAGLFLPRWGDGLILFNGFCLSAATISQKKMSGVIHADLAGWGRIVGALIIQLPFLLWFSFDLSPSLFQFVLWIAICNVFVALFLTRTLEIASASYMTMMSMSVPLINSLIGFLWLKESLLPVQAVGGVIIVLCGIGIHRFHIT